jgi:predicted ATP-grasp superfamily ATP-dependent carboligase
LGTNALKSFGSLRGYIGIDLVLGVEPDGSDDFVVEINPRPTTSYVGLRAAARTNLAEAMLRIAEGYEADILFDDRHIVFNSAGEVH